MEDAPRTTAELHVVPAEGWREHAPELPRDITLRELGERRLARLVAEGRPTADLRTAYHRHLYPAFGGMRVVHLRVRMFVGFVRCMLQVRQPATVRRLLHFASALLSDAVAAGLIAVNPARVPRGVLPPAKVRDDLDAAEDVFELEEIGQLLFDVRLPFERRLFYALSLMTGLRFGEAAALAWDDVRPDKPLLRITVRRAWVSKERILRPATKTGVVRAVPVHPCLEAFFELAREWFHETFGRAPTGRDLVAPRVTRFGKPNFRLETISLRRFAQDLEVLGLRRRTLHQTRATFVSRLGAAGVDRELRRVLTHPPRSGESFDRYDRFGWASRCDAVRALDIRVPRKSTETWTP